MNKCDFCIMSTPDRKCRIEYDDRERNKYCEFAISVLCKVIEKKNLLEAVELQEENKE